jgi:hypothetical protein
MAGRDYPRSYAELRAWFDEDWKCLDWLRWPEGFVWTATAEQILEKVRRGRTTLNTITA